MHWDKAEVKQDHNSRQPNQSTSPMYLPTAQEKINLALQMNMHKVSGSKPFPYNNTAK
jgi:hypothetical protein